MKTLISLLIQTSKVIFFSSLFFDKVLTKNFSEWQMRMATTVHHTNPRSATLDFWRKTTKYDDYKILQAKRRAQMNRPTR